MAAAVVRRARRQQRWSGDACYGDTACREAPMNPFEVYTLCRAMGGRTNWRGLSVLLFIVYLPSLFVAAVALLK